MGLVAEMTINLFDRHSHQHACNFSQECVMKQCHCQARTTTIGVLPPNFHGNTWALTETKIGDLPPNFRCGVCLPHWSP